VPLFDFDERDAVPSRWRLRRGHPGIAERERRARRQDDRALFERLAKAFPGAYVAFDSISPVVVGNERLHDSMRFMPAAPFRWGLSDVRAMERWLPGLEILDTVTVPEIPGRFPERVGLRLRMLAMAVRVALAALAGTYRIALARLPGASRRPS
jgi:hypothetical protein